MDVPEIISLWKEFVEINYLDLLLEQSRNGENFITLNFQLLTKYHIQLSELLIENPEEHFKSIKIAIEQFDLPNDPKKMEVRISNLPESQKLRIRDIRAEHIGKLYWFTGTVRQKSDVRPRMISARFECPSCGNVIAVLQDDKKFKEPSRCGCGRKGKFRLLSKVLIDNQGLYLEESSDDLSGNEQPKRMKVLLQRDLVRPIADKKTNPGTSVKIVGVIKEVPQTLRTGSQSVDYDLMIEANHVQPLEDDNSEIKITPEEEAKLREMAKDKDIILKLRKDFAPKTYGHEIIKEALMLQLTCNGPVIDPDGFQTRGDIHILLIGDPGCAKSQMIKRACKIAPISRFVSGKGASGAGLTFAIVKDEFVGGWALEAGMLVLAHKGLAGIDELDKISDDDTSSMHEAMEGQTLTPNKANIHTTLKCETAILAAANPKMGRFDPYAKTIAEQIDLPITLINRFDLILPVQDKVNEQEDYNLAKFILKSKEFKNEEPDISEEMLRKYFKLCKSIKPIISEEIIEKTARHYVETRSGGDGKSSKIPINARVLESLKRFMMAYARLRLSSEVNEDDFERAKFMMDYYLKSVAFDQETGTIDFDRVQSGISGSDRDRYNLVKDLIRTLEKDPNNFYRVPIETIYEKAQEQGIDENKVDHTIDKLKRNGDIYEPKAGFWKLL